MKIDHEPIAIVAIPTRDNAEELRDAVGSCVDEAARWGRGLEIVVFDDSRAHASVDANRAVLREAARSNNVVRHATPKLRRRFTDALAHAVGDRACVELGLHASFFECRYGAVRNTIALELSGRAFLSLDDDMSLRGFRSPDATRESSAARGDPTELWFFSSASETRDVAERDAVDVIGAHHDLLGASPRGNTVAATWTGFYGNSGTPTPWLYLCPEGASFERLTGAASFEALTRAHQIIRAVRGPTTASGGFWTTGAAAYGADPTPPFFPILRGEGLVFGALSAVSSQELGYVPAIVEHRSRGRDEHAPLDFEAAAAERSLAPIVAGLIHASAKRARGSSVDLARVGRDLASMTNVDGLLDTALGLQRARRATFVGRLRALLAIHGEPSAWRESATRFLHAMSEVDARPDLALPTDLIAEVGRENTAEAMRDAIASFGRLLVSWEGLHIAARDLRASGITSAEVVAA